MTEDVSEIPKRFNDCCDSCVHTATLQMHLFYLLSLRVTPPPPPPQQQREGGRVSLLWRAEWSLWYLWLLLRSHMRRPRRNKYNRPQLYFHLQIVILSGRSPADRLQHSDLHHPKTCVRRRSRRGRRRWLNLCVLFNRWQEGRVWTSRSGGVSARWKRNRWDQYTIITLIYYSHTDQKVWSVWHHSDHVYM